MNYPYFPALNWNKHLPIAARIFINPVPHRLRQQGLALGLNRSLKPHLQRGELDFLADRWVAIDIPDIHLNFCVTLSSNRLLVDTQRSAGDVCFTGNLHELLLLITGKADPDTLFFRRRLMITGDTELGLFVKNFLDTLEAEQLLPGPLFGLLDRLTAQPS